MCLAAGHAYSMAAAGRDGPWLRRKRMSETRMGGSPQQLAESVVPQAGSPHLQEPQPACSMHVRDPVAPTGIGQDEDWTAAWRS